MALCGARKQDGTPCRNRVAKGRLYCHRHRGGGAPLRVPRPPSSGSSWMRSSAVGPHDSVTSYRYPSHGRQRGSGTGGLARPSRVDSAARLCQELLVDGWQETVSSRAADYLTAATWRELTLKARSRHCRALARLAQRILTGKKHLHDVVGSAARKSVLLLGGGRFAQTLAAELATKIPLPFDEQAVAVARGIQVSGILLCLCGGRDLTRCACFVELAREEVNDRVKQVMSSALGDWRGLARFPLENVAH